MTKKDSTRASHATKPPMPSRRLKVRMGMHDNQLDIPFVKRTKVGEILLKGNWMIQAGFTINSYVKVEVLDKRLVITPE